MSERRRRRYDRSGVLALAPTAFFDLFFEVPDEPEIEYRGDVALVPIRGPLEQHRGGWLDSYEAVVERVRVACESDARAVVLCLDSPGGEVHGCFDAARKLRSLADASGKHLVAHIAGCGCSAAYALACAADEIVVSDCALVGSVGVLATRVDASALDARMGVRYALVASGSRKTDGNEHALLTDAELATLQSQVDALAGLFFELVASMRPSLTVEALAALDAAVVVGASAVDAGLADRVGSLEQTIATIGGSMADDEKKDDEKKDDESDVASAADVDAARAALERAAAGDDDYAERARAALRALNGEGDDDDEDKDGDKDASARAASSSVSAGTAGDLAATVNALAADVRSLRAERDDLARSHLIASRTDLAPELAAYLRKKPLAEVRNLLAAMPKPAAPRAASSAVVTPTRGGPSSELDQPTAESPHAAELDAAFGLTKQTGGVRREGATRLVFQTMPRERRARPASDAAGKGAAK